MANALNYQIVSNTTTCKSLLLHICNCNFNNILFTKLPWPGDSEETFRPSNQAAILNSIIYSISIVVDKLQRLNQWFPTAGPRAGASPLKFFAGLLSIYHCNVFVNYKTHFMFGQFSVDKTCVTPLACDHSSKISAHITVIQRKKKKLIKLRCVSTLQSRYIKHSVSQFWKQLLLRIKSYACQSK